MVASVVISAIQRAAGDRGRKKLQSYYISGMSTTGVQTCGPFEGSVCEAQSLMNDGSAFVLGWTSAGFVSVPHIEVSFPVGIEFGTRTIS